MYLNRQKQIKVKVVGLSFLIALIVLLLPNAEAKKDKTSNQVIQTGLTENTVLPYVKKLVIPEDTILTIKLTTPLDSAKNKVDDSVSAITDDAVYLGPYLAVPKQSTLTGKVAVINNKTDKEGRHPYIVVVFDTLTPEGSSQSVPFNAVLIAYKTGYRRQEYVWRLPQKGDDTREAWHSTLGGAVAGAFVNPIVGPVVGAGVGLAHSGIVNKFARGGAVKLNPSMAMSITVQQSFSIPINNAPRQALAPSTTSTSELVRIPFEIR